MTLWTQIEPAPGFLLTVAAGERGIRAISLSGDLPTHQWARDDEAPLLKEAGRQLREYFRGERTEFDLPLEIEGTPFQVQTWRALQEIPYGETRSYGDIARMMGKPTASRAVGGANHRNKLPIVIPCHRVIAGDGSLGGFGCGIDYKIRLLDLEQAVSRKARNSSSSAMRMAI